MKGQPPARMIKKQRGIQETCGVKRLRLDTFVDVKQGLANFLRDREERGLMKPARSFGGLEYGVNTQQGGARG